MALPSNIKIFKNPSNENYWEQIYQLVITVEKWFNMPADYDIWRNGFGEDFSLFIAVDTDKDKAVGSASAVNYRTLDGKPLITCNGMVFLDPEYRGKNIGLALSKLVMGKDVGFENKALIAVPAMSQKYKAAFGFTEIPEDNMSDVELEISKIDFGKLVETPGIVVKTPEEADWPKIFEFDHQMLKLTQRDKFLKLFCTQKNTFFKIAVDADSKIVGMCNIRAHKEMKLCYTGPFYAKSLEMARTLFLATLKQIPDLNGYKTIRLAFYGSSHTLELLKDIAPNANLEKSQHFVQFTKKILPIPRDLVYSVTENDCSYI